MEKKTDNEIDELLYSVILWNKKDTPEKIRKMKQRIREKIKNKKD